MTLTRMREYLGRKGYSGFFENVPQIISRLTMVPPKRFTVEQKELLNHLFLKLQAPFEAIKGKRKNFLSYSYVSYKLCELLKYNEFLPLLRLLDHRNLLSADEIWRKVCAHCGFEFIPTT